MHIVDLYPLKGTFKPGEMVKFLVKIQAARETRATLQLTIWHLNEMIDSLSQQVSLVRGAQSCTIEWSLRPHTSPLGTPRGYGVVGELLDEHGQVVSLKETAIDVLSNWTSFPRYGFLTDFTPGRDDAETTLEGLARFHINGLQFYDWHYRHDRLLAPTPEYIDPLGRELSLATVCSLIDAAHDYGMAAMAYLAVYAASLEFWRAHPDWGIYDQHGQPLTFMDFLGLMDPTPRSAWIEHLLRECAQVLAALPFDGLHVDQYGDPKEGFDAKGAPLDIPSAFADFIGKLKDAHPSAAATFNAVGNWPIETLATTPQDFMYIEIWPPKTSYLDLPETVLGARRLSGGKPVVIAVYLPVERPANIRLADALIFSSGGARIEIGEKTRLLADPYFPKHQPIPPTLECRLRSYYDFAVRYAELIGPNATDHSDWPIEVPTGIWKVARTSPGWLTICLINLNGLGDTGWDQDHPAPPILTNVPVEISSPGRLRQVWWSSPDSDALSLQPLSWRESGGPLRVYLPSLEYWGLVALELAAEERD